MASSSEEGEGNLKGAKLWGVGALLREYEFTPDLLLWLEPLVAKGMPPSPEQRTARTRIWGELYSSIGTTGAFSPSAEYYAEKLQRFEYVQRLAITTELKEFLRPLIEEARRELKAYELEESEE